MAKTEIERLRLQPIILAEQDDNGLTVIEKLEKYSKDCDFALILLTADDKTVDGGVRGRQNVVHEMGYFHGLLGRDKVLLLTQTGIDLFSNISGLIYKEFEGDKIETIFEDIRKAIESGALTSGKTIQKPEEKDLDLSGVLDAIANWPKMDRDNLSKELRKTISGLSIEKQVERAKYFLCREKEKWERRLKTVGNKCEKSEKEFKSDPEHGGKMAVMTMNIFEAMSPKAQIELISKLLDELDFGESNKMEPQLIIDRIFQLINTQE